MSGINFAVKKTKIIFLFSGQGSQYRKMGQNLYQQNKIFKASLEESEIIIKEYLNTSLIDELYFSNEKSFDNVLITHPAVVAVQIAMYSVVQNMNIIPDYVSGNSLGEFVAAVASGIWDKETAIIASIKQAESIVKSNCIGSMLAVINVRNESLTQLYKEYNLFLASDNFEGHFSLSGLTENIEAFQQELKSLGIHFFHLPVRVAFHSPIIEGGFAYFNRYMKTITLLNASEPGFISGIEYKQLKTLSSNYFEKSVSQYNNYPKTVKYIESKGSCLYIDLGPSGTSSTFVKYNLDALSKSKTFQIMTPFSRELEQLKKLKDIIT